MSLLEVVLAIGLTALVALILFKVLIPSMRVSAEVQERTELRQQGLVAGRWLERDLRLTNPAAIGVLANPAVLTVQPYKELSVDGTVVWEQELLVYTHEGNELKRGVWDSTSSPPLSITLLNSRPARPSLNDLNLLLGSFTRDKAVARHLAKLDISHGGLGESVAGPLKFDFEFQVPNKPHEFFHFQKIVSPRMGE